MSKILRHKLRQRSTSSKQFQVIEEIKNIVPVAYVVIVFWGLGISQLEYSFFGIEILSHMDLVEILFLLYNSVLVIIGYFALGIIFTTALHSVLSFVIRRPFNFLIRKLLKKKIKRLNPLISVIVVTVISYIILDFHDMVVVLYAGIITIFYLSDDLSESSTKRNKPLFLSKNNCKPLLLIFTLLLIVFSVMKAFNFKDQVLTSSEKKQLVFHEKTREKIITGKDIKYIGETKNYIFLFDMQDAKSITIQRSDLEEVNNFIKLTRRDGRRYFKNGY